MIRSQYGFYHGERYAVFLSLISIAATREENCSLKMQSLSRSRYLGAVSHGKASTICWAVQLAVGCSVTLKCTICRLSCIRTIKT